MNLQENSGWPTGPTTDGKITEEWVSIDTMGSMQQIGAIPTAPSDSGGSNTT